MDWHLLFKAFAVSTAVVAIPLAVLSAKHQLCFVLKKLQKGLVIYGPINASAHNHAYLVNVQLEST